MPKVKKIEMRGKGDWAYMLECPGCGHHHAVWTKESNFPDTPTWDFNGDFEKPTFNPSLLVRIPDKDKMQICHSFIRDGKIQFLSDCSHHLAGKTVDLPEIE
jgi:hypothetical protein